MATTVVENEDWWAGSDAPAAPDVVKAKPSEAQLRANRANAKRSTGPKTPAGKARSAQNAIKTGIYSRKLAAITVGPYAEDPDEIAEMERTLIDALDPHNALQLELARQIAGICLNERRLNAWEHGVLSVVDAIVDFEDRVAPENVTYLPYRAVCQWNLDRTASTATNGAGETVDMPWEAMHNLVAGALRKSLGEDPVSWADEATAPTASQMQAQFIKLIDNHFASPQVLRDWLKRWASTGGFRKSTVAYASMTGVGSVETMERTGPMRTRLNNDKLKLLAAYLILQKQDVDA